MGWLGHLPGRLRAHWRELRAHPERVVFDVMVLLALLYVAMLYAGTYNGRF